MRLKQDQMIQVAFFLAKNATQLAGLNTSEISQRVKKELGFRLSAEQMLDFARTAGIAVTERPSATANLAAMIDDLAAVIDALTARVARIERDLQLSDT